MYKKYLKLSSLFFIALMLCIAMTNIIVDPGEIYLKKFFSEQKSKELTEKLLSSKKGVIQTGWNERLVKVALAKATGGFDCVVLGSSRVMQVSIIRNTGGIKDKCTSLINLGVSGGGIEDVSIFSYLVLKNLKRPKRVFIGIDPWTLKFNMDSRYGAYQGLYENMNALLGKQSPTEKVSYSQKIFENLFNGKYFYQSIRYLIKGKDNNSIFMRDVNYPDTDFSYDTGYIEAVTLADGSHLYAKPWVKAQKNKLIKTEEGSYKIDGIPYDPISIKYLNKIIDLLKKNHIKVELVMIPYHPNVFKIRDSKTVKTIQLIDEIVKKIAKENGLKYYGSFMPDMLGCKSVEFYDFMHPTIACLNKINFGA